MMVLDGIIRFSEIHPLGTTNVENVMVIHLIIVKILKNVVALRVKTQQHFSLQSGSTLFVHDYMNPSQFRVYAMEALRWVWSGSALNCDCLYRSQATDDDLGFVLKLVRLVTVCYTEVFMWLTGIYHFPI